MPKALMKDRNLRRIENNQRGPSDLCAFAMLVCNGHCAAKILLGACVVMRTHYSKGLFLYEQSHTSNPHEHL